MLECFITVKTRCDARCAVNKKKLSQEQNHIEHVQNWESKQFTKLSQFKKV